MTLHVGNFTVTDGVSGNHEVDLLQRGVGNYTYYQDGSLQSDENKEITNIIYDSYLDKPKEVQLTGSRWVKMSYDGGGSLLKREFSTGEYWDFVSNTIYKNGVLYQMGTPEGRAVYQNSNWQYEFFYQDHLSNARVSFGANGQNLVTNDITDFDPTGIPLSGIGVENSKENRFKFLNRERIPTFDLGVYQLGARMYDPQRMQFWSTDPLIDEGQNSFTPFHYSFNNPIRFSDPSGLIGEPCCGDGADGIGNGMSLVENIYYSTRDLLTSSIATIGTAFASVFGDVKPQRINATYNSGSRTLSSEVIPKGEVAQEVAMSTLALASAIPSGGSVGTGMLMAKAGTKVTTTSAVVKVVKEGISGAKDAQKAVFKNQAPKGVDRVDIPKLDPNGNPLHGQKSHAHIKNTKNKEIAVNQDGTYKHGEGSISDKIKTWLKDYGWKF